MSATADPFHEGLHPGGYSSDGKCFIAAASGQPINLMEPDPKAILLADVARGLSMTCRFAGQVDRFYSVAEHCALVLDLVRAEFPDETPWELDAWALLHDAPEGYIHDVTGPLKHVMQQLHHGSISTFPDPYSEIEARWTEAVRVRFELPVPDMLLVRAVKRFDHRAACLEGGQLKANEPFYGQYTDEPLPGTVQCAFGLPPDKAEALFLARCSSLGIR